MIVMVGLVGMVGLIVMVGMVTPTVPNGCTHRGTARTRSRTVCANTVCAKLDVHSLQELVAVVTQTHRLGALTLQSVKYRDYAPGIVEKKVANKHRR